MTIVNFNISGIKSRTKNLQTFTRGVEYYTSRAVKDVAVDEVFDLTGRAGETIFAAEVKGHNSNYDTSVTIDEWGDVDSYVCNCAAFEQYEGYCKHIVALLLKIYYEYNDAPPLSSNIFKINSNQIQNYQLEQLINIFENKITDSVKLDEEQGDVELTPIIVVEGKDYLGIEFTIGNKKQYVVKDAYALAENIKNNTFVKYGKNLEFDHRISGFSKESRPIAIFLRDECQQYKKIVSQTVQYAYYYEKSDRELSILPCSLDEVFNLFANKTINCKGYNFKYKSITFVDSNPEVEFFINEENKEYYFTTTLKVIFCVSTKKYTYIISNDKLYRCTSDFANTILPAAEKIASQSSNSIHLTESYMGKFFSAVLPQISKYASVKSDIDIAERFKIQPLTANIYLDTDKNGYIYADVIYAYGDTEINPIKKSNNDNSIARNLEEELKIQTSVENCGFVRLASNYAMMEEDSIYEFLTDKINILTELCEVNVSEEFKKINIRYPKSMAMGVKMKSNLIEINMEALEFDPFELKDILSTYKKRKKYFRLKDGSFLNLDNDYFNTIEKLVDDLGVTSKDLLSGHIDLPKYRSLYLDSLIKNNTWINASRSQDFKEMIRNIKEADETDFEVPESLKTIMRNYQMTGFKWLKILAHYSLGGILADDMGLGKTLQIISLILSEKNENKPSIVVSPTSLVYNWKSEIEKFAPDISTLIISGTAEQRKSIIDSVSEYDLIITSYDLIKRDIECYKGINFRYCILDEAQYIKNANTQNAKAVKLLKSDVRFALTGTPIENSLADLWSIFDFIMPGFLLSYKKFKDKYEMPIVKDNDQSLLTRLHNQIKPFILRRLKKDVLKELPDKIETISYAQMDELQKKVYFAELMKINQEFNQELSENGFEKSQIKILAMLTRLRQICCHPALYFDNYKGGSAKLELCMQLISNSIENGHKVLVFSQFTSMLSLIQNELDKNHVEYFTLTGATKSRDRLELANQFNTDDTSVFLISLKAGGTGLNLTGADVVIHFDPWWNLSAQNQATDRTHRIGQKNKVQVFKLIAKDTIEEKIEKLQQRKANLADSIIKEGEIIINSLTKEEINSLFDM